MKTALLALAAALSLCAAPALAQGDGAGEGAPAEIQGAGEDDAGFAGLAGLFSTLLGPKAEPLTAEAEARLPAAREMVGRLFPPGTYGKLMQQTLDGTFDGLMGLFDPAPASEVARLTGLPEEELAALDPAALGEALDLLDPAHAQRSKVAMDVAASEMVAMGEAIEPAYREGMASAFASRFTADEIAELNAFFSTPTGAHYAEQSMLIYADPQVMGRVTSAMPMMFERIPQMTQAIEAQLAALPQERFYDGLAPADQARLSTLLGRSAQELEAGVESAQALKAAKDAAADSSEDWGGSWDESWDDQGDGGADDLPPQSTDTN